MSYLQEYLEFESTSVQRTNCTRRPHIMSFLCNRFMATSRHTSEKLTLYNLYKIYKNIKLLILHFHAYIEVLFMVSCSFPSLAFQLLSYQISPLVVPKIQIAV